MSFHIKIGNYRFSKNLGTGSFGKVKLAFNEVTGHKVAIKILNKKKIKQQGVFEKVKREIKVLRLFNHPHIIKHYEFIDTPSDIFMVIEYASGGELFDLISRRERLEEDDARRFFQQIFSSIEYTHAHKIAHRDLKPENLLLDENNNIKLIDFGLANSMKDSQALKTACGSPNYAAPEVISGRAYSGVEVDVWSLGVILFAMVCGSLPFDDDSMSSLFNKIKEGKYYMPNYVSPDVKDLINRMLQPNPVKRITMKEIKEHIWYLKDLPLYLQELSEKHVKKQHEIDNEIIQKIFTLNINFQGKSQEEVLKAIKEKKNTDFCGIYELYFHDKLKKECFKEQHKEVNEKTHQHFKTWRQILQQQFEDRHPLITSASSQSLTSQSTSSLLSHAHTDRLSRIMKKIKNGQMLVKPKLTCGEQQLKASRINSMASTQIETTSASQANNIQPTVAKEESKIQSNATSTVLTNSIRPTIKWSFGLLFKGTPTEMITLLCDILRRLEIEWQVIPKDLKMKCRSRIDESCISEFEQMIRDQQQLKNDNKVKDDRINDDLIKELIRKNFIKFYINIYKDPNKSVEEKYMLDIHLFKGTVFVYMDFVKKFLIEIQQSCTCISRSPSIHSSPLVDRKLSLPENSQYKSDNDEIQSNMKYDNIKIIL